MCIPSRSVYTLPAGTEPSTHCAKLAGIRPNLFPRHGRTHAIATSTRIVFLACIVFNPLSVPYWRGGERVYLLRSSRALSSLLVLACPFLFLLLYYKSITLGAGTGNSCITGTSARSCGSPTIHIIGLVTFQIPTHHCIARYPHRMRMMPTFSE